MLRVAESHATIVTCIELDKMCCYSCSSIRTAELLVSSRRLLVSSQSDLSGETYHVSSTRQFMSLHQDVWDSKQVTSAEIIFEGPGIFNVDGEAVVLRETTRDTLGVSLSLFRPTANISCAGC